MTRTDIFAAALIAAFAICASQAASADVRELRPLPPDAIADYQLGGSYPPPAMVTLVVRDSTAEPASGLYNICYINGFQTQPEAQWPRDLLVARPDGRPLADPGWPDEYLLNISTAALRARIFERIKTTIARCAEAGFDAVEFDNLDSYTRSHGALAEDDAVAFARLLVGEAHRHGLAAGQKNAPELSEIGKSSIGFDFAISEQCHRFAECAAYTHVYGNQVVDIEYAGSLKTSFRDACDDAETPRDTLLRDMKLSAPTSRDYAYEHCTQVSPGK